MQRHIDRRRNHRIIPMVIALLRNGQLTPRAVMKARLLVASGILLALLGDARALSCTVSATSLAFGDVTSALLANAVSQTTGTISYSCTGATKSSTMTVCLALDNYNASNTRSMTSGSNALTYQIYSNSGYSTAWGDAANGGIVTVHLATNSTGAASGSSTVYAQVLTGQTTTPAGSFSQTLPGGGNNVLTAANGTSASCTTITSNSANISFTTTATVSNECTVSVGSLNFGSVTSLSSSVAATTTTTLRCTNGDAYTVGLNAGSGSGATISARKMTSGSNTVTYSLYQNSADTTVWGNTVGTNTVAGTGTGGTQTLTVYGLVPAQTVPAVGTFTDTVVVTATY
jgi:spore coat protein U-like protein